jgi:AraC-like DNA-binding protein
VAANEWVTRLPAPPLRPFVDRYIGYRLVGFPPGLHRGLPSRHLTFMVSIGDAIDVVAQTDPGQAPGRYGFVLGGLQARPALIAHGGDQEGVAVELTPLGCRGLLGLPAATLWNLSLEAGEVLGPAAAELRERLHLAPGWDARFAACDVVLGRLAAGVRGRRAEAAAGVREAWRVVVASGGTVPVADLAAHVGWSRRHLGERFAAEFGLSPKLAARVVRFERARWMLQSRASARGSGSGSGSGSGERHRPGLADVAAACGYYDQPHLNRDFAELAGCSPLEWLAAEGEAGLPSVQDGER